MRDLQCCLSDDNKWTCKSYKTNEMKWKMKWSEMENEVSKEKKWCKESVIALLKNSNGIWKKKKKEKGLSRDVGRRVAKVGDGRSDVTG